MQIMSALNLGVFTFISNSLQRTQLIMFLPETCSKFWIFFLSIYRENFHQGEGRMALTELRFNGGRNAVWTQSSERLKQASPPPSHAQAPPRHFPSALALTPPCPAQRPPAARSNAAPMDPTRNAASHSVRGKTGNHAGASN